MASLYTTLNTPALLSKPTTSNFSLISKPTLPLSLNPQLCTRRRRRFICLTVATSSSSSTAEIDMVRNRHGVYTPKQNKVVVLWDLDNKPPRGPPYPAAIALKQLAQKFGDVIEISAYANRHAFIHLPQWVREERRERKELDILERKGISKPSEPYICGVCGRKCKTNLDLKKHFKQLHERERQKKVNRMKSLKGKKRQRFKERFIDGNYKYNEEARRVLTPKVGYGLAGELKRAGVYVKTVEDKPQAADWAVKRQIEHSMSRGVDWLVLISDDSDFSDILRRAREASLGTVVVGDRDRALGRNADLWVPWSRVENGEIGENDLVPRSRKDGVEVGFETSEGLFSVNGSAYDEEGRDLDSVVDEIIGVRSGVYSVKVSAFSEGEDDEGEEEVDQDYLIWDSDDEIEEEDEVFIL